MSNSDKSRRVKASYSSHSRSVISLTAARLTRRRPSASVNSVVAIAGGLALGALVAFAPKLVARFRLQHLFDNQLHRQANQISHHQVTHIVPLIPSVVARKLWPR